MRVLVIEDNPLNQKLINMILRKFDVESFNIADGTEAIQKLPALQPDIVLCDIQLPGVDGIGILEFIRSQDTLKDSKVVAITAHALVGDRDRFIGMGFDHYISKPFDTRKLRDLLENLIVA